MDTLCTHLSLVRVAGVVEVEELVGRLHGHVVAVAGHGDVKGGVEADVLDRDDGAVAQDLIDGVRDACSTRAQHIGVSKVYTQK